MRAFAFGILYAGVVAITLELRPDLEAWLQIEARANGLGVGNFAGKIIEEPALAAAAISPGGPADLRDRLLRLARQWHELPTIDQRSADEILGYNDSGLPG